MPNVGNLTNTVRGINLILDFTRFTTKVPESACFGLAKGLTVCFAFAIQVSLLIAAFDGFAFVVFAFAAGHCERQLHLAVLEIEFEGNQRIALFIGFGVKLFYFPSVKEQFAGSQGVVIVIIGEGVGADSDGG